MQLFSFTYAADTAVARFQDIYQNQQAAIFPALPEKLRQCPFNVYLIIGADPIPGRLNGLDVDAGVLQALHLAWSGIFCSPPDSPEFRQALGVIEQHGSKAAFRTGFLSFNICRLRNSDGNSFFILLEEDVPGEITARALWIVCNLWQAEFGRIPLHASGIMHAGYIYLFSGPSGAGKSTISSLSAGTGKEILDEDQVMIYRNPDGSYSANAWGYSLKQNQLPVRAFFRIYQDRANRLAPLSKTHTARLLMEGAHAVVGIHLPEREYARLFRRAAELARSIPGYELHFRKSPDFWKLIDAEFPPG